MRLNLSELSEPRRKQGAHQDYYDCPFCSDSGGHMGVNTEKNIFHCFKCGASGRTSQLSFLGSFERIVKQKFGDRKPLIEESELVTLPVGSKAITPIDLRPYKYLRDRGITQKQIEDYELKYTITGLFAHRIIVPIKSGGLVKYFLGRTYLDEDPRYMNAAAPKGDLVFTTWKNKKVRTAVLCEGVFDAISVARVIPAMSALGKAVSDAQAKKIKSLADEVIVMFDSDAKVDAFKTYERLGRYLPTRLVFIKHKDPGEMTTKEILEAI